MTSHDQLHAPAARPCEADLSGYEQPDPEKVARWLERGYGAARRDRNGT